MARTAHVALAALLAALALGRPAAAGQRALLQNAGPYNENSLVGVPDEINTGEQFGSGEKVNVCHFPLGSVNAWNMKPYIQYLPESANVILEFSGRGSFIAPAVGFLHYGPSCYLYDHVCNFNYQEPCNLRGTCQTNNTCFCTNGYATCRPQDGTMTSATAGCETDIYTSRSNCGTCGNVCATGYKCVTGTCTPDNVSPSPPPPPGVPPPPPPLAPSSSSPVPTAASATITNAAAPGSPAAAPQASDESSGAAPGDTVEASAAKPKAQSAAKKAANRAAGAAAAAGRRLIELFK